MIKKYKIHIIWALIVVVALVGGVMYGKSTASAGKSLAGNFASSTARGGFAGRGGAASGGLVTGTIASITGSSMTVQLPNGNSEVVLYSNATPVTEPTTVSVSKLTVGATVMVGGSSNSDGSLTATTIQIGTGRIGVGRPATGTNQ
jgi:hypothetical protein